MDHPGSFILQFFVFFYLPIYQHTAQQQSMVDIDSFFSTYINLDCQRWIVLLIDYIIHMNSQKKNFFSSWSDNLTEMKLFFPKSGNKQRGKNPYFFNGLFYRRVVMYVIHNTQQHQRTKKKEIYPFLFEQISVYFSTKKKCP